MPIGTYYSAILIKIENILWIDLKMLLQNGKHFTLASKCRRCPSCDCFYWFTCLSDHPEAPGTRPTDDISIQIQIQSKLLCFGLKCV